MRTAVLATLLLCAALVAPAAEVPGPAPECSTPQQAVELAATDALRLPPEVAAVTRYLWSPLTAQEREKLNEREVLDFALNCVSLESEFSRLREIAGGLYALRLDELGQGDATGKAVYSRLTLTDPYFHAMTPDLTNVIEQRIRDSKVPDLAPWLTETDKDRGFLSLLVEKTQSNTGSSLLRADYVFTMISQSVDLNGRDTGAGYYAFHRAKTVKDLAKLVEFNEDQSVRVKEEVLGAIADDESGISDMNRLTARYQSVKGAWHETYDFRSTDGFKNVLRHLGKARKFSDAGEGFFRGPNRLWKVWAADEKGALQATVPDFIGGDTSIGHRGNSLKIHNPFSCFSCHLKGGLQDVNDFVRDSARWSGNPDDVVKAQVVREKVDPATALTRAQELKRQFFSDLNGAIEDDRRQYERELRRLLPRCAAESDKATRGSGSIHQWFVTKYYVPYYNRFTKDKVTPARAAREIGTDEKTLVTKLQGYAKDYPLDNPVSLLLRGVNRGMSRRYWEDGGVYLANAITRGNLQAVEQYGAKAKAAEGVRK